LAPALGKFLDNQQMYIDVRRRRILAFAVDLAIAILIASAIVTSKFVLTKMGHLPEPEITRSRKFGLVMTTFGAWYFYSIFSLSFKKSTFGMRLMSIQLRKTNGKPITIFDYAPFLVWQVVMVGTLWLLSLLITTLFPKHKRLPQDFVSGLVMVRVDKNLVIPG
jgi:uncharacterized RDD family membrane protein YckC